MVFDQYLAGFGMSPQHSKPHPLVFHSTHLQQQGRRLSCAEGRLRYAGLLLPSLNVHADHEEPEHQRKFREAGGDSYEGEQVLGERW